MRQETDEEFIARMKLRGLLSHAEIRELRQRIAASRALAEAHRLQATDDPVLA